MNRTAGFEKHLDERMERLGFSQSRYELDYGEDNRPIMMVWNADLSVMSNAALRDLASRLKPDFNAVVKNGQLVFMPVKNLWVRSSVAGELVKIAKQLAASDVGEKVTFYGDSFQMPFDVPDAREHRYTGVVVAERGDMLTIKLATPPFAAGQVMKISLREETLEIG